MSHRPAGASNALLLLLLGCAASRSGVARDGERCVPARVGRGNITVFAPGANGNVSPVRVLSGPRLGSHRPAIMAVDQRGYLYVTSATLKGGDDTVRVFGPDAAGNAVPERVLAGPRSGIRASSGLAVDRRGRLYVGNNRRESPEQSAGITVYEPGASGDAIPVRQLFGGGHRYDNLGAPDRIALGRGDSVYVRTIAALAVYSPTARDMTEPARYVVRTTPGPQYARISAPNLFVLDPHDSLYAVAGDTIEVYPPGYSGSGDPVRRIAGPRTGLRGVKDMTMDRQGRLYVLLPGPRADSALVQVYHRGASGDVPPARTIAGARTRLSLPTNIAVDRKGQIYVANVGESSTGECVDSAGAS